MTAWRGSDVQRAIDFLSSPNLKEGQWATLPPRPDYEVLAWHARELGYDCSPEAVQGAFQLMMRARLLVSAGSAQ
jgi:hypothetical protein